MSKDSWKNARKESGGTYATLANLAMDGTEVLFWDYEANRSAADKVAWRIKKAKQPLPDVDGGDDGVWEARRDKGCVWVKYVGKKGDA
jgi:putative component of toxin-antitoxin plasmid stabilization module